ncbi:hypothetical protein JW921_01250, partial [Candidatus Fermentibacterales bacterium]|nr:hypothetical protein [Candidatus Fermentibacterales bacterium]
GPGMDGIVRGLQAGDRFVARISYLAKGPEGDDLPADRKLADSHRFRILEVLEPSYPELGDEFAARVGKFESLEDLRKSLRESFRERFEKEAREQLETQARKELVERNEVDPPRYMVANIAIGILGAVEDTPGDEEQQKATSEIAFRLAESRAREYLVLRGIALAEGIEVSGEDIEKARREGESDASVRDRIRNARALELVTSAARIEEVPIEADRSADGEQDAGWEWILVEGDSDSGPGEG